MLPSFWGVSMKMLRSWLESSWGFFKRESLVQDITIIDVIVQCLSFQYWTLYLTYTSIRCTLLLCKYVASSELLKKRVLHQVQLYLSAKVVGIILSQFVLVAIGYSSFSWALVVLLWGVVLSSLSFFAYRKALI